MKENNRILVGSRAFFSDIPGFEPKDTDWVLLNPNPVGFNYFRQFRGPYCLFEWKQMTPDEFIEYTLKQNLGMVLGKFLVPEFNNRIGFTIEHLKKLEPMLEKLDEKHQYEKIIYDAYISNNSFTLTPEQKSEAYKSYKESRVDNNKKE